MPKNITYHETEAQTGRRRRNAGATVASAGLTGATIVGGDKLRVAQDDAGRAAGRVRLLARTTGTRSPALTLPERAKYTAQALGRESRFVATRSPGAVASTAAIVGGSALFASGAAKNKHHTQAAQKLRRNRVGKSYQGENMNGDPFEVSKSVSKASSEANVRLRDQFFHPGAKKNRKRAVEAYYQATGEAKTRKKAATAAGEGAKKGAAIGAGVGGAAGLVVGGPRVGVPAAALGSGLGALQGADTAYGNAVAGRQREIMGQNGWKARKKS
jgi:hypothetical protein